MGPIDCPERSVKNYHFLLCKKSAVLGYFLLCKKSAVLGYFAAKARNNVEPVQSIPQISVYQTLLRVMKRTASTGFRRTDCCGCKTVGHGLSLAM